MKNRLRYTIRLINQQDRNVLPDRNLSNVHMNKVMLASIVLMLSPFR